MDSLFDRLDRSWNEFTAHPVLNRRYPDALALAGDSSGWDEAQAWMRTGPANSCDRVLACLCGHASRGEQAATQIVMALLMPGMVKLVNETSGAGVDEREHLCAAAVWERIATYPIERRPTQVALNVLWDARRQMRDREPPTVALESIPERPATYEVSAGEELLRLLRERVDEGRVEPALARLIARCRVGGERAADIARESHVDPTTVTYRRRRAEAVLAAVA